MADNFVGELKDYSEFPSSFIQNNIAMTTDTHSVKDDVSVEIFKYLECVTHYQGDAIQGHNQQVGKLSAKLAIRLGMSNSYIALIYQAAQLHDIGKIGISDSILSKPGKLTSEERQVMQEHCQIGANLLASTDSELLKMAQNIAIAHHERWNGEGYPFQLVAIHIPLEARIVAVADVFDALLQERSYKKAWSIEDITALFREKSGIHFDPLVVTALLDILHNDYSYNNFQLTN